MNILMVIPTLSFGGAENIAVGLAEEAIRKEHRVTFITFYGGNDYSSRLNSINCEVIQLNYQKGFGFRNILSLVNLRNKLLKKIKSVNPDIIHTHLFLVKMVLYNKRLPIPVIDTQHDISPWWSKKSLDEKIKTHIEKKFANTTVNKIVSISNAVKESLVKTLKVKDSKVLTVFNFVERNSYPVNYDFPIDKFKILVISRIQIEKKGLDLLIDTISLLTRKYGFDNCIVTVVGDGPDMKRFQSMIDDHSLSIYFNFVGYQKDIYKYYSESDLVLMTSRWEGFGLTAAEAAMSGRAVVGFNIPGLNEVVIDQKTGILVEPYNVKLLANEIAGLVNNTDELKRLSNLAIQNARSRFDKQNAFLCYEKQYYILINGN